MCLKGAKTVANLEYRYYVMVAFCLVMLFATPFVYDFIAENYPQLSYLPILFTSYSLLAYWCSCILVLGLVAEKLLLEHLQFTDSLYFTSKRYTGRALAFSGMSTKI